MDDLLKLHYRALNAFQEQKIEEAIEIYEKLDKLLDAASKRIKKRPDFKIVSLATWRSLGDLLQTQERYQDGNFYFLKALNVDDKDLTLWFSLAKCAFKNKSFQLSLNAYEQVLKINSDHLLALEAAIPLAVALDDTSFALEVSCKLFGLRKNSLTAHQCLKWLRNNTSREVPTAISASIVDVEIDSFLKKVDEIKKDVYNMFDHPIQPEKRKTATIQISANQTSNILQESETESSNFLTVLTSIYDFVSNKAPNHFFCHSVNIEGFEALSTEDDEIEDESNLKAIDDLFPLKQKLVLSDLRESQPCDQEVSSHSDTRCQTESVSEQISQQTFDSSDYENLADKQKELKTQGNASDETTKNISSGKAKKRLMFSSSDEASVAAAPTDCLANQIARKVAFMSVSSSNESKGTTDNPSIDNLPLINLEKKLFELNSQWENSAKEAKTSNNPPEQGHQISANQPGQSSNDVNNKSAHSSESSDLGEYENPFVKRILKDLKTSVRYDEVTANNKATRSQDLDNPLWAKVKKNQKMSMEPIYEDLLKFVPIFIHPNEAIRSEQLFSPEVIKANENFNSEGKFEQKKVSNEVRIKRCEKFDFSLLKAEYPGPNSLYFDILRLGYSLQLSEIEWGLFTWVYSQWRKSLPHNFILDETEVTESWLIIANMTEALIIREFMSYKSVRKASLRKSSFLNEYKTIASDIDSLFHFVHNLRQLFGKSYLMWCYRLTFVNGVFSLLTHANLDSYQFLKFASLNFGVISSYQNFTSIKYIYGDRELVVNDGYLKNLMVQVRVRLGPPDEDKSSTTSSKETEDSQMQQALKISAHAKTVTALEPVLDNLTAAKRDLASLICNLRKLKSQLSSLWKKGGVVSEEKQKFSLIQLKSDIATIEIYLGCYVLTKGKDFNTEEIMYHLDTLLVFSEFLFELSTEFKMRLVHCMLTILHITINRAKGFPVDGIDVTVNTDELERLKPLVLQSAAPWVILAKLIQKEELNCQDSAVIFNHLSPESREESQVPMYIKFLMEGHEYFKESKLKFCHFSGGLLMNSIIDSLTDFLQNQSLPITPHYRKIYEEEIDQCYFCLYQLKRAKARTESHCTQVSVMKLEHVDRILYHFLPSEKPSFDNMKAKLTNDESSMLRKVLELCWPDFDKDSKFIMTRFDEAVNKCLELKSSERLEVKFLDCAERQTYQSKLKPGIIKMLHFLADHCKHAHDIRNALKLSIVTLFFEPENLDCWIVVCLCQKWLIDSEFLDIETFPPLDTVLKSCRKTFLCFQTCISLNKDAAVLSTLQIELGLLYYHLCSFIRRSEDYQESQNFYSINDSAEQFYREALKCFNEAFKVCNFEDKWLCHYMIGKITQKINPRHPSADICEDVLDNYLKSILLLEEMGARVPRKITIQQPQTFSVEILELIYRLFASAIKMIDTNNCVVVHKFLKKVMKLSVIDKHLMKVDEQAAESSQSSKGAKNVPNLASQSLQNAGGSERQPQIISVSSGSSDDRATVVRVNEIRSEILSWSIEVFKCCARRYTRHAKSLYRLAEITWTKLRNVENALKFLYNPETTFTAMESNVLPPLFLLNAKSNNVIFQAIYRPNCHEVDRCGSYYHLVGKAALTTVDMLVQVGALDELAVFAKGLSKAGEKFYMHEPVRAKIYEKSAIAFMQIAQRDLQFMPTDTESLSGPERANAELGFKMLAASVHKFLSLRLPFCTEDYKIHRKLKKVVLGCYVRSSGDLDYESNREANSNSDTVTNANAFVLEPTVSKNSKMTIIEAQANKYADLCVLGVSAKFSNPTSSAKGSQTNIRYSYRARCCATSEAPAQIAQGIDQQMRQKNLKTAKKKKATLTERKNVGMVTDRSKMPKGFRSSMLNQ